MKKIATSLLLGLLLSFSLYAQDSYHVIHTVGQTTIVNKNKTVATGDKIQEADKLKFADKNAKIIAISPQKGRYIMSPTASAKENELEYYVKNVILPVKSTGRLSTRGNSKEVVQNLKDYLGTESFVIIGNELSFRVDGNRYPLSKNEFFAFRYTAEGVSKPINKMIAYQEDRIFLDKEALFTYEGKEIDHRRIAQVEIFWLNQSTKASRKILSFQPIFLDEEELKKDLLEFKKVMQDEEMNAAKWFEQVVGLIKDVYGRTDEGVLKDWLVKNSLL
jgi:hypothetical protein